MLTWKGRWGRLVSCWFGGDGWRCAVGRVFFLEGSLRWTLTVRKKISGIPKVSGRASFCLFFWVHQFYLDFFVWKTVFFVEPKNWKELGRQVNVLNMSSMLNMTFVKRWPEPRNLKKACCKPSSSFGCVKGEPCPCQTQQLGGGWDDPCFFGRFCGCFWGEELQFSWMIWVPLAIEVCILKIRFFTPPP